MYYVIATLAFNFIDCSYMCKCAAVMAVFLSYVDKDQSVFDW